MVTKANLRAEIRGLRTGLRAEIAELRTEVRTGLARLETKLEGLRGSPIQRPEPIGGRGLVSIVGAMLGVGILT